MTATDREKEKKILKEREETRKGFKPQEGGDSMQAYDADLGLIPDQEPKELKEKKLRDKGLKPVEGGDPIERVEKSEKNFPGRVLPIGLGMKRNG